MLLLLVLGGCHPGTPGSAVRHPAPPANLRPDQPSAEPGSGRERSARSVVAAPGSHLYSWAADARGDLLGIWSAGSGRHPRQAFAVRTATGEVAVRGAPTASFVQAALTHGWIVSSRGRHGMDLVRIGVDAVAHPLAVSDVSERPRPGDVLVRRGARLVVYRPSTGRAYDVPKPPLAHPSGGYVTASGALVVAGSADGSPVWATLAGHRWTTGAWPLGQVADVVVGAGDHVVVVLGRALGNGIDATGVAGLAVSDDAGRTWRTEPAPSGVVEALSAVVLPSGTAFVSTGPGQLLRARPGRPVDVVPGIRPVSLSSAHGRLVALTTPDRRFIQPVLRVTTDQGRTWSPLPAPGRQR